VAGEAAEVRTGKRNAAAHLANATDDRVACGRGWSDEASMTESNCAEPAAIRVAARGAYRIVIWTEMDFRLVIID
jgi:hypothetical protein